MNFLLGLLEKAGLTPYLWLIKLIGIAVLCAALLFAWSKFTGHYEDIGFHSRDSEVGQLQVDVRSWKLSYDSAHAAGQQCSDNTDKLKVDSDNKRAKASQALKAAEADSLHVQNNIRVIAARERSVTGVSRTCSQAVIDAKGDLR